MPDIKSLQQARSELPGSAINASKIDSHVVGSAELGIAAPLIHKGTQIATRFLQKGSMCKITHTGSRLVLNPAFAAGGTPLVFLKLRAAGGTLAEIVTPSHTGGTVRITSPAGKGTYTADYLVIDPSV